MPNDLIALIKQKQEAIAKLEAELAEARAMLLKAPSRQEGNSRLPTDRASRKRKVVKRTIPGGRQMAGRRVGVPGIQPTSSVGLTVEVLRQAGKPLHVTEIIRGIEAKGNSVNKITLVGNLCRYVQKKQVFFRAAPNVFGLIEMRKG